MKVFKFGGASIKDAKSIENVGHIVRQYQSEKPVLVVSALGKTTNALEAVVQAYFHQTGKAQSLLDELLEKHLDIVRALFPQGHTDLENELNDLCVDIQWIIEEPVQQSYDYIYDQIVSTGEFLSTKIVSAYLNSIGIANTWLDVRDCIATDNTYREANVNWALTQQNIQKIVPNLLERGLVLTQGFIGVTSENFTTTLGREGSDYTAAIFSYCLDAKSMTIWKDVVGVLTADPRLFPDAQKLDHVSYEEAIEMTYYGAQVIHPNTIRPLQNKNIPLYVKSFINPEGSGTYIQNTEHEISYPPIIVVKEKQALLKIFSKDFYFVDEARFARLFDAFAKHRVKVNMTQNTALAFSVCVNDVVEKIDAFVQEIEKDYTVEKISALKLITIRHSNDATLQRFTTNNTVLLEEKIRGSVQLVIRG